MCAFQFFEGWIINVAVSSHGVWNKYVFHLTYSPYRRPYTAWKKQEKNESSPPARGCSSDCFLLLLIFWSSYFLWFPQWHSWPANCGFSPSWWKHLSALCLYFFFLTQAQCCDNISLDWYTAVLVLQQRAALIVRFGDCFTVLRVKQLFSNSEMLTCFSVQGN